MFNLEMSSQSRTRLLILFQIITDHLTELLRDLLISELPSSQLTDFYSSIKSKSLFNKTEETLIKRSINDGYKKFDLSLLIKLLKCQPGNSHLTRHLDVLLTVRNRLYHLPNTEITQAKFEVYFNECCDIASAIEDYLHREKSLKETFNSILDETIGPSSKAGSTNEKISFIQHKIIKLQLQGQRISNANLVKEISILEENVQDLVKEVFEQRKDILKLKENLRRLGKTIDVESDDSVSPAVDADNNAFHHFKLGKTIDVESDDSVSPAVDADNNAGSTLKYANKIPCILTPGNVCDKEETGQPQHKYTQPNRQHRCFPSEEVTHLNIQRRAGLSTTTDQNSAVSFCNGCIKQEFESERVPNRKTQSLIFPHSSTYSSTFCESEKIQRKYISTPVDDSQIQTVSTSGEPIHIPKFKSSDSLQKRIPSAINSHCNDNSKCKGSKSSQGKCFDAICDICNTKVVRRSLSQEDGGGLSQQIERLLFLTKHQVYYNDSNVFSTLFRPLMEPVSRSTHEVATTDLQNIKRTRKRGRCCYEALGVTLRQDSCESFVDRENCCCIGNTKPMADVVILHSDQPEDCELAEKYLEHLKDTTGITGELQGGLPGQRELDVLPLFQYKYIFVLVTRFYKQAKLLHYKVDSILSHLLLHRRNLGQIVPVFMENLPCCPVEICPIQPIKFYKVLEESESARISYFRNLNNLFKQQTV